MNKRDRRNQDAMRAGQSAWDNAEPPQSDDAVCPVCGFECSGDAARAMRGVCPECESNLERV
jgi:hypothetical protein